MKEKKIKKFALGVEYNGSCYHGWQRQKGFSTVQEEIENALSKIANHQINVVCSGRTDSGVHSIGQVIHFTSSSIRSDFSWTVGVNTHLSKNISIKWIKEVPEHFSARYSAISRSYRYMIYNNKCRSAIFRNTSNHVYRELNVDKMFCEAQSLLGEHDFSSFRALGCQSSSPRRKITKLNIWRLNHWVIIDITANSFLYHMVRNIVGSLITINNHTEKNYIKKLLNKKNRNYAGPTAPAQGLYLFFVKYPMFFNLPTLKNDFII
ncbi:tRNA pseudouridine(38-40) synthase TruA [uncultured Buchnera sp.]|jgi:tRNA pseudouridine38-40 synthase|uniref:tRNA pseudouridine(38-40) synthase TruA n=1 Tax=uncultured Buchnera sp. TaxID=574037 RepID=UPI0025D39744|nr:tRNA pseudouridine(38-40) synthase TruA [uncultured Buchnera sp.]